MLYEEQENKKRATALFEQYFPKLLAYVTRNGHDRESAEDIVQDVFFKIFRHPQICPSYEDAPKYLTTAVYHGMADAHKKQQQRQQHFQGWPAVTERSPEDILITIEVFELVDKLVNELDARRRDVVKLHLQSYSTREIAIALGMTEQNVLNTKNNGLHKLIPKLIEQGVPILVIAQLLLRERP